MKYKIFFGFRAVLLGLVVVGLAGCGGEGQDQTVADYPIAYIKRPIELETQTVTVTIAGVQTDVDIEVPVDPDITEATAFSEGGDVYLRERASPSASERNITLCLTDLDGDGIGTGDVKDLETSFDGTKLIFSLRLEDMTNGDNVPKWNIYEYDTTVGGCPTMVIPDLFASDAGDDVAPAYLPDGRIVYSSTASVKTGEVLLNEGKTQFSPMDEELDEHAAVLHVMDADGSNIKQISFNQSHDLDASVLSNGKIVFSRWDGAGSKNAIRLYTINPDGTELNALYGLHENRMGTGGDPVQFIAPRELDDGRVLAILKPFAGSAGGGAPVKIDVANYTDFSQSTIPNLGMLSGPGQVLAINQDVRTDGSISPAGRYRSVYPLGDGSNRALVSWSQCRLQPTDPLTGLPDLTQLPEPCPGTIAAGDWEASPLYGIYIYDFSQNTQLPVVIPEEGVIIDEPVVLAPRQRPTVLIDKVVGLELDETLAEDEFVGILHIRSVYDFDGKYSDYGTGIPSLAAMSNPETTNADARPARYLRIIKATSIPDPDDAATAFDDNVAFGVGGRRGGMREIIGYAPIEPDGSVMVKVPANVPLAISIVDKDGRRVSGVDSDGRRLGMKHLNWIQVSAGETLECGGCHDHNPTQPAAPAAPVLPVPHGYSDAPTALNTGAPTGPYTYPGTNGDFIGEMNETMAQARIRTSCTNASSVYVKSKAGCPELSPNPSPMFFDVWAKPADVIPDDIDLRYAELDPSMHAGIPAPANCIPGALPDSEWDYTCRAVINYETSIHPIWSAPRTDIGGTVDRTCTSCHSKVDAMGNLRLPDGPVGQLDLGDGTSVQGNNTRFKSYHELMFRDNKEELVGTVFRDEETPRVDAMGNPVYQVEIDPVTGLTVVDPVTGLDVLVLDVFGNPIQLTDLTQIQPFMSANGARASDARFFNRFNTPGDVHEGILSRAEVRLLSEWLDIGGQYFNTTIGAP